MERLSRRSFVKLAGAATGAAAVSGAAPALAGADSGPQRVEASTPVPHEPIVAVVRDAARGEITILVGTHEATYRDRALVKRLQLAARLALRGVS